jgi:hypothetical protein
LGHTWPSLGTSYKILDRNDYYWPITKYSYVVVGSDSNVGSGGAAAADDDDDNNNNNDHFWPGRCTDKLTAD